MGQGPGVARSVSDDDSITRLLRRWRDGEPAALNALLPLVYAELQHVAAGHLRSEPEGSLSLQATALVHETFLKLVAGTEVEWSDRNHFFAIASRLMRQILVDHARKRHTDKRSGGERVTLTSLDTPDPNQTLDLLALDQALNELETLDARKAQVVELRVFAGLEFAEIGEVMGLSRATLDRDFRTARAWLIRAIDIGMGGVAP